MDKKIIALFLLAFCGLTITKPALSFDKQNKLFLGIKSLKNIQFIQPSPDNQLKLILDDYMKYSNNHDIEALNKLYAQNFLSGDGLKKDEVLTLIKETWDNCPDIHYLSEVKDIRINDNYAAVETIDKATSQAVKKSELTNDNGNIESYSKTITYFQKVGKNWKIISDKIIYELTAVKYGCAKNIDFKFYAPEQVFAGDDYTASLKTNLPKNKFAFASISKEPIVHPQPESKEIFRQIDPEYPILERVMKANTTNNNELASASVGITEISGNLYTNPKVKLTGLAVLFQRVNVIPKSTYIVPEKESSENDEDIEENFLNDTTN